MPDMLGTDFIQYIILNNIASYSKIVLQSGTTDKSVFEEAIRLGAYGTLQKPYSLKDVLKVLQQV
jgi:DNA-binding NarL/FixJ family response regulator